ncbi:MAG: response regulator transcription factor [Algicola sp.]|nr:response regulator transcription factor [Algicola sp.]
MTKKAKLLVVEDEMAIQQGLVDLFVFNGYEVEAYADGKEGLDAALQGHYDLILLDVMLPSMDGFTICNEIRKQSRRQPIIMLTAKNAEEDVINGLTLGADDYIAKPFSIRELLLRVEAVLRLSGKHEVQDSLKIGKHLEVDVVNLSGTMNGKAVLFTRREIDVMCYLKENQHKPVARKELLTEIWKYSPNADIDTRTVDIHIAKLRKKIELDHKNPQHLVTVRGEGYKLIL